MNYRFMPLINYIYDNKLELNSSTLGISDKTINKIKRNQKVSNKTIDTISQKLNITREQILEPMPLLDLEKIADPCVKWLGGKRRLYNEIKTVLPKSFNRYIEPFVGGGAVLFLLHPCDAIINDLNSELINCYKVLKSDKYMDFIRTLNLIENKAKNNRSKVFYELRNLDRLTCYKDLDCISKAARFLFLNKNSYNGVYRVNSLGYYNVPFNKKITSMNYHFDNLLAIHNYFQKEKIKIFNRPYQEILKQARPGDFVYLDPPYDSDEESSFVQYTKDGFSQEDTKELAKLCRELDKRGCFFLLSNHSTTLVREEFKGFNYKSFSIKRNINSIVDKRRTAKEILIWNYDVEGQEKIL